MNRTIVTLSNWDEVLATLDASKVFSFDTETFGLELQKNDRLFALIISTGTDSFYFNFQDYPGVAALNKYTAFMRLRQFFDDPEIKWYAHNAKFDLWALYREGVEIAGPVHCTQTMDRLVYNDHLTYSLADCAARIGEKKDVSVEEYLSKHKLWSWKESPDKKTRKKRLHFDRVPFDIISKYGFIDAEICFRLGEHQKAQIKSQSLEGEGNLLALYLYELLTTQSLFKMETNGISVDTQYCQAAIHYEQGNVRRAEKLFEQQTGEKFVDSNKALKAIFQKFNIEPGRTEKGNPSFTDDVLSEIDHPVASLVREVRERSKRISTYYQSFIELAVEGKIHPTFKQAGTATARLSCAAPNLQNVPKEEDQSYPFLVRRAFVPSPGNYLVSIDYDQMEYRMMLNYAGQEDLIAKVAAGLDVHQATAEMMGTTRQYAKTLNFMLLYGGGSQKLADALGLSLSDAQELKAKYFRALPRVEILIDECIRKARVRGYVHNWMGRRYYFKNPHFAYKAPNYLIQGGCAEVVKIAMNQISGLLLDKKTKMLLQVHDELLFDMPKSEFYLIPEIKKIMESVCTFGDLPLTCSVELSKKSWADKKEWENNTQNKDNKYQQDEFSYAG